MAEYRLEVTTDDREYEGKWDHIIVTLFGKDGQSEETELGKFNSATETRATFTMTTNSSLGKLLLIKVEKDPHIFFPEDEWYCSKIVVTTPDKEDVLFPCHRWIIRKEAVELRGGKARKVFEEDHPLMAELRKDELMRKKNTYQWKIMDEGLPHINSFNCPFELPVEVQFKYKSTEMRDLKEIIETDLNLKDMENRQETWPTFDAMKQIYWYKKTRMSDFVAMSWMEDAFYGWQFLNGVNPNVIKRCKELPPNFLVTNEMVQRFLKEDCSLEEEMDDDRIFLYDQKKMEGIPPRDYDGQPLHVTPGLCLFYLDSEDRLRPIAIQLQQKPCLDNPIFLPSDSQTDWLLAKLFIKNADFLDLSAVHHLLRTHFLAEVYALATLRCLPAIHPLYKLLMPHFRYTLFINTGGREALFGRNGILNESSLGRGGMIELMRRGLAEMTYSSLCLPENIAARGLECIPNFYYRDDGLKLWNIISNFVTEIVEHFYSSDSEVRKDTELQEWISEIFIHGVLGNKASGFPMFFDCVDELAKFITMVIFTVSAQHAAVGNGQFDYHSWMPNGPLLLRGEPPTTKGNTDMERIFEALPNIGETVRFAAMTVLLSEQRTDMVRLGLYPEERFSESDPKEMIKEFQENLYNLSAEISKRNSEMPVPYTYLNPDQVESSVAV